MSFLNRRKGDNIAPVLKQKLDSLHNTNGHANGEPQANGNGTLTSTTSNFDSSSSPPETSAARVLIIGAGSRGAAYARAINTSGLGTVAAVCEPNEYVRKTFGEKYIWGPQQREAHPHEAFESWTDFIRYEQTRRERIANNDLKEDDLEFIGVDAAFVCVLDDMHIDVVKALAPLGLHVMCEKPLATSLQDCIDIYGSVVKSWETLGRKTIFSICHVLRYSPHNMLLHKLVREDKVVGDVISIEHTEPVGWWHFTHSFVRGNWRREDTTAPSLLTKSCHDIDWLLWMLCSPAPGSTDPPHLPSTFSSSGTLNQFRKARKPIAAGGATNCLSCPIEESCIHSAKKLYIERHFNNNDLDWPVKIVVPEIEDIFRVKGQAVAKDKLLDALREDYDSSTPDSTIKSKNWFGRCVYELDNDVCDDQTVTITWQDDPLPRAPSPSASGAGNGEAATGDVAGLNDRGAKSALFHMIAPTELICERRGRIYGTTGEISYDSFRISVTDFRTGKTSTLTPPREQGGHGGGDDGLATNFLRAVNAVEGAGWESEAAQRRWLGCSLEEVVRSHVAVFAAEEARLAGKVVDWKEFWERRVESWFRGKA